VVTPGVGFVYGRRAGAMTGNGIAVRMGFLAAAIALDGFARIVTSIDRGAAVASNEVISFRVRHLVHSAVAIGNLHDDTEKLPCQLPLWRRPFPICL
jgi:hypothetical protein